MKKQQQSSGFLNKPACVPTEGGWKLEIPDLGKEELYYMCSENIGADQLCSFCTTDLHINLLADQLCGYCTAADVHLCFCVGKIRFFHDTAHM